MRYMRLDRIPIGSKLGRNIVTHDNQILVRNGTVLTEHLLEKLKDREYDYLYIEDDLTNGILIDEVIPQALVSSTINSLKKMDIESTITNARSIVDNILSSPDISADNYNDNVDKEEIFKHSILVTELSVALGKIIGLDQDRLNDLAVSALLHDIGKLCTNKEEIEKLGVDQLLKRLGLSCSVEEYQEIMHSFIGYSILNKNVSVSATIKQAILMHHERVDGKGLLHFPAEKIGIYGKIINITDTFSRLITNSHEVKVNNTSEVIEYLRDNAGTMFDDKLVKIFISRMPIYPPGVTIELSDGNFAIVCQNNLSFPTRPKIILENGKKIDLSLPENQNITVIGVNLRINKENYKQR